MIKELRQKIANLISPIKNSMSLANEFLKYGNKGMKPDWTEVVITDRDLYTGYGYAVIRNRANNVSRIATENVRTQSNKEGYVHPYLEMIQNSNFPVNKFWNDISTFLDLEGVYYLMVVRNVNEPEYRFGNPQSFVLLNPYNIRRVLSKDKLEVIGYVETRKQMVREIPKDMIIEMRELNPFNEDEPFAMTDAAKENQFTMKTAGDYTRKSLKNNIGAPGILSTDVLLDDDEFDKFVARAKNHTKGEPLFGNGSGSITWKDMQIDLTKAGLKDIHDMNREGLFSVSGLSKTTMGIEESGTTRDTSKVQKELYIENHILPRIQLILDALNLDYKLHYKADQDNKALLVVDNPLGADHDAEMKETQVFDKRLELKQKLINKGVDDETASSYVLGKVEIDAIKIPKAEIITDPNVDDKNKDDQKDDSTNMLVLNASDNQGLIQQQEGSLKNAIINIDNTLLNSAINRLPSKIKNAQSVDDSLITKKEKNESIQDLTAILMGFYGIIINLFGQKTVSERSNKYTLPGFFAFNRDVKNYISETAKKVAESHITTITDDIYKFAQEAALEGLSVPQIQSKLKANFTRQMTETRAKTIAKTETNRAFTRSQFEADKQFISQNKLEGRAYKQWRTRSGNPCEFCQKMEAEGKIPFGNAFRDIDGKVIVGDHELDTNFETVEAGNLHPNCQCTYELIIEEEKKSNNIDVEKEIKKLEKTTNDVKKMVKQVEKDKKEIKKEKNKLKIEKEKIDKMADELSSIA